MKDREIRRKELGLRDADCGCCVVVDQVAFRATMRAIGRIGELAAKWEREVIAARQHGVEDPKSSKQAHARAVLRILGEWDEAIR